MSCPKCDADLEDWHEEHCPYCECSLEEVKTKNRIEKDATCNDCSTKYPIIGNRSITSENCRCPYCGATNIKIEKLEGD